MSNAFVFYAIFASIGCLQAATFYEPAFARDRAACRLGQRTPWHHGPDLMGASTVFIPLIQLLISMFGWRDALMVLGAINILICGGLYFLAIDPAKDYPVPVRQPHEAPPLAGRKAVAWAMRRPVFWALVVALVGYEAAFAALTFHLYPLLLERGLDTAGVVTVLAVIGPAQVAGRIRISWPTSCALHRVCTRRRGLVLGSGMIKNRNRFLAESIRS